MLTIISILSILSTNAYAGGDTDTCNVPCDVAEAPPAVTLEDAMRKAERAYELARRAKASADAHRGEAHWDEARITRLEAEYKSADEALKGALAVLSARVDGTEEQIMALTISLAEVQRDLEGVKAEIARIWEVLNDHEERMDGFSGLMTIELGAGATLGRAVPKVVDPLEGIVSFRLGFGIENRIGGVQLIGGFVKLIDDSHRVDIGISPHLRLGERVILSGNIGGQFADYGMVYGRQLDSINGGSTGFLRGLTTGGAVEGVLLEKKGFRMTVGGRFDVYGIGSDWAVNGERMGIRGDAAGFVRFTPKVAL